MTAAKNKQMHTLKTINIDFRFEIYNLFIKNIHNRIIPIMHRKIFVSHNINFYY